MPTKKRKQTKLGFKNRLLAVGVFFALCLFSLCFSGSPSHACCQNGTEKLQKELPACCVVNPAGPTSPSELTGFSGPLPQLSANLGLLDYQALLSLQPIRNLSSQACAWQADESDRYLALRVLRN